MLFLMKQYLILAQTVGSKSANWQQGWGTEYSQQKEYKVGGNLVKPRNQRGTCVGTQGIWGKGYTRKERRWVYMAELAVAEDQQEDTRRNLVCLHFLNYKIFLNLVIGHFLYSLIWLKIRSRSFHLYLSFPSLFIEKKAFIIFLYFSILLGIVASQLCVTVTKCLR